MVSEPSYKAGQYIGTAVAIKTIKSVHELDSNHLKIFFIFSFQCFQSIFFVFAVSHPRFKEEHVLNCKLEKVWLLLSLTYFLSFCFISLQHLSYLPRFSHILGLMPVMHTFSQIKVSFLFLRSTSISNVAVMVGGPMCILWNIFWLQEGDRF